MDRNTNYAGQVPLETDLLNTNRNTMTALAKLSAAVFGTAGMANGFATSQSTVPAMSVLVAAGEVYQLANLDGTAYSSLAADTTHSIVKQGLQLDPVTLAIASPGTAGFSVNYLIEVSYQDSDTGLTVLPYYNASNPSVAYSGPANSGTSQPTKRAGIVSILAKAGVAATTGAQTTPAPDSGYLGLYVVTVANGASTVVNANISAYPSAPLLASPLTNGRLIAIRQITSTQTYNATPGTTTICVDMVAAGGGGAGSAATAAGQVSVGGGGGPGIRMFSRISSGFNGATITIGAGGSGGALGAAGVSGGATSFGGIMSAAGGLGGVSSGAGTATSSQGVGAGAGSSGTYLFASNGVPSSPAIASYSMGLAIGGQGGSTIYGAGGTVAIAIASSSNVGGNAANGFGAGGSGGASGATQGGSGGGAGTPGMAFVYEYA